MSLALWLRTGRTERKLSLGDVARITKIQPRILERLEGGKLEGLPAEVFVRGFIRSFAKCCGLDEAEALTRYTAASQAQAAATAPAMPGTLAAPPSSRTLAMIDAMSDLAPQTARANSPKIEIVELAAGSLPAIALPAIELAVAPPTEVAAAPAVVESVESTVAKPTAAEPKPNKKKQRGKKRSKRGTQPQQRLAAGTPFVPAPVVAAVVETAVVETAVIDAVVVDAAVGDAAVGDAAVGDTAAVVDVAVVDVAANAPIGAAPTFAGTSSFDDAREPAASAVVDHLDPLVEPADANEDIVATEAWQPKMPPVTTSATVPWRRPYVSAATSTAAASVPTLVIDDADPDAAAQVVEDREAARSVLTNAQRRSFLPPILLDREDRGARQGGLTLAVIILLIAATLTLSYLMRRPSSSGDGVTMQPAIDETTLVG